MRFAVRHFAAFALAFVLAVPASARVKDPEVLRWLNQVRGVLDDLKKCKESEVVTAKSTLEEIDNSGRSGLDPSGLRGNIEDLELLLGAAELACGRETPTAIPPHPTPDFMSARPEKIEPGRVAVLPVWAPDVDRSVRLGVEDALRGATGAVVKPGGFDLATASQVAKAVKKGKCDGACALATGTKLKAKAVVSAIVVQSKKGFVISVRVFDPERGAELAKTRLEADTIEALRAAVRDAAPAFLSRVYRAG